MATADVLRSSQSRKYIKKRESEVLKVVIGKKALIISPRLSRLLCNALTDHAASSSLLFPTKRISDVKDYQKKIKTSLLKSQNSHF